MTATDSAKLVHVVTLRCKDTEHASRCINALATYGRPDALSFGCHSYEFGLQAGTTDTVCIVERWSRWEHLDALLREKVVLALPMYNTLLRAAFDPARDTLRVTLAGG